jgi:hypothetical protein
MPIAPRPSDSAIGQPRISARRPLMVDLYCGLGGWAEGGLAEGYDVVGFDIERHEYGAHRYPAHLVIQDVLTLHGSQFRDAALIVASPPCQAYSYRAMPWKRAKALPPPDNALFEACFRIQREACAAAGRHIPLIIENVRGAQKWVGRARWNYGSFYLWGDVPALMPITLGRAVMKLGIAHRPDGVTNFHGHKNPGSRFDGSGRSFQSESVARKNAGGSWFAVAHNTTSDKGQNPDGRKVPGGGAEGWFGTNDHPLRQHHSGHAKRKAASALIAKIPLPLSRHIAATFHPRKTKEPAVVDAAGPPSRRSAVLGEERRES